MVGIYVAVNNNPYQVWQKLRQNSDYRSTDTQITSLVRQQLSQSEYLRNSNRVNPGPNRNTRVKIARNSPQIPHVFVSDDMWGWQNWVHSRDEFILFNLGTNLIERVDYIPGTTYLDSNIGGMSYNLYSPQNTGSVQVNSDYPLITSSTTYNSYIGNISVDVSNLTSTSQDYLMMYNSASNKFEFKSPQYILGISDGDFDTSTLNFGGY